MTFIHWKAEHRDDKDWLEPKTRREKRLIRKRHILMEGWPSRVCQRSREVLSPTSASAGGFFIDDSYSSG
jgi:hypothetical protein